MQFVKNLLLYAFLIAVCSNKASAEDNIIDWSGEVYGGRYYDDKRHGSYVVISNEKDNGLSVIGEFLYEDYKDYDFLGVGGHVLWPIEPFGDIGVIASQAWESYDFNEWGENKTKDYQTHIVGLEWELEKERLAIATQVGKHHSGYDDKARSYLSADLYYWGSEFNWYLRGATRQISSYSLYLVEGYRTFTIKSQSITAYIGAATDSDIEAIEGEDSIYAGSYLELFSTSSSTLTLWLEASKQENDTLLTVELNLAFGPGARTPYITAFGFALDD